MARFKRGFIRGTKSNPWETLFGMCLTAGWLYLNFISSPIKVAWAYQTLNISTRPPSYTGCPGDWQVANWRTLCLLLPTGMCPEWCTCSTCILEWDETAFPATHGINQSINLGFVKRGKLPVRVSRRWSCCLHCVELFIRPARS